MKHRASPRFWDCYRGLPVEVQRLAEKHRASPRFWDCYRGLPVEVQRLADASYKLLKTDLRHPGLHFKKAGGFWSVRVGLHYRALAVEEGDDVVWFWIGHHAEYDRLVGAG